MSDKMTDEQVRAELTKEQLQAVTFVDIDGERQFIYGLKPLAGDLAESQQALGEISNERDKNPGNDPETDYNWYWGYNHCLAKMRYIARKHYKGGK